MAKCNCKCGCDKPTRRGRELCLLCQVADEYHAKREVTKL
jgi:hypothetical protein